MTDRAAVDTRCCTSRLRVDYPHTGVYDIMERQLWIARKRLRGPGPMRVSHARMLGTRTGASTATKDRFLCYWFHTPYSGEGLVHGYPIEWEEGHLMVRLEPHWSYLAQKLVSPTDTPQVERNIEQQFDWAGRIFSAYLALGPSFPLSWHMIGPRAADSMFYVQRVEPGQGIGNDQ